MKNIVSIPLLSIIALSISGCLSVNNPNAYTPKAPAVENFNPSYQRQLNASVHWQVIADDIASQLKQTLRKKKVQNRPVYLNLYSEDTSFTEAFKEFLISRLVKKNVLVSRKKIGSTIFNYKIQAIKFNSFRTTMQSSKLGFTTLASGVLVARDILRNNIGSKASDILFTAVGIDFLISETAPRMELLISSSILSNDIYLHKNSDVYYVNELDSHLYVNKKDKSNVGKSKSEVFNDPFYQ